MTEEKRKMLNAEDRKKLNSIDESKVQYNIDNVKEPQEESELKFTSFEKAKKDLQIFSKKTISEYEFPAITCWEGPFDIFDHKVTGWELRQVVEKIQNYFIKTNELNTDLIREFGDVYTALESLDKEYIPAILNAIKSAEKAGEKAKQAADHARIAQKDIEKTLQAQKQVLIVLEKHRLKLDQIEHLQSIDEIWKKVLELEQAISVTNEPDKINKEAQNKKYINELETLKLKIKYAYYIAGTALGVALIGIFMGIFGGM